jgi:hypothetical protein
MCPEKDLAGIVRILVMLERFPVQPVVLPPRAPFGDADLISEEIGETDALGL